jgi:hypothetical protein
MLAVCPLTTTKSDTLISKRARSPGSAGMGRPRRCKSSHSVIEQHPFAACADSITAKKPDIVTAIATLTVRLRIESPLICGETFDRLPKPRRGRLCGGLHRNWLQVALFSVIADRWQRDAALSRAIVWTV